MVKLFKNILSFLQSKSKTVDIADNKSIQHENAELFLDQPLDTGFDYFCDNSVYKVRFINLFSSSPLCIEIIIV